MTAKRLSRRQRALAEQKRRERKRWLRAGGIAALVVVVLGGLYWAGNRPRTTDSVVPAGADRNAWGLARAPVVIEEWSDFG